MLQRLSLNNNHLVSFLAALECILWVGLSESHGLFSDLISNNNFCLLVPKSAAKLWPCANVLSVMCLTNELELQMDERLINVSCRVTAVSLLHPSPAARYLLSASQDGLLQI